MASRHAAQGIFLTWTSSRQRRDFALQGAEAAWSLKSLLAE